MPRLAKIKVDGPRHAAALAARRPARTMGSMAAGAILFCGAGVGGALLMGGSLFNAQEAFHASADHLAAAAGFKAQIDVRGVEGARKVEIEKIVLPEGRNSVVAGGPAQVRARVESLDWVEQARVSRFWPSTIMVTVKRREAIAVWQENQSLTVIDRAGERVHNERPGDNPELIRVVGPGAGPAAAPLLTALEDLAAVREKLASLHRVGDRRWDIHTVSGMVVLLPEADPVAALIRLETMQRRKAVLDGPYAQIDLRNAGRPVARPRAPLAAPNPPTQAGRA
jgi:cell division protein FtsQ